MKKVSKIALLMLLVVSLVLSFSCNSGKDAGGSSDIVVDDENNGSNGRVLVAYFSATNNTKGVAEKISNALDADVYRIEPTVAYTSADLNWRDANSRVSRESKDLETPEIKDMISNLDDYDVIFIGYPIWGGYAPKIVNIFVENSDFSGKTIIPFCTSASSGFGQSGNALKNLDKSNATWKDGQRFQGSASEQTIKAWLDTLSL